MIGKFRSSLVSSAERPNFLKILHVGLWGQKISLGLKMVSSTGDFCRVYHLVQRGGGGLNEQGVCQSVVCSRMADSLHWNCPIKSAMSDPRDCHALHLTANKVHHVTHSLLHCILPNRCQHIRSKYLRKSKMNLKNTFCGWLCTVNLILWLLHSLGFTIK